VAARQPGKRHNQESRKSMLQSRQSYRGMVVAPHHAAAEAGARVLRDGGNAIEAMLAAAAAIAVVYPHMNSLGGDNFWLIHEPGQVPLAIDACGGAAAAADVDFYQQRGHGKIPDRGPLAALTMAGAVSGWHAALQHSQQRWQGKLSLARLLEDAIEHAEKGVPAAATLANNLRAKRAELQEQPGFADFWLPGGKTLDIGQQVLQPALANTLRRLAASGLDDFYRGELARELAAQLAAAGSPLQLDDFQRHRALQPDPLQLQVAGHTVYNLPPPTQGLASLMLLGIYERLGVSGCEHFDYIHGLVESTKQAFRVRDREVSDPAYMRQPATDFLQSSLLDSCATDIDRHKATPWPDAAVGGDTVWLGAIDAQGRAVSFIQSIYWEFGSGVVLPEHGIVWQNRGTSFSLDTNHHNCLQPERRPFHTIQPALALLDDGRVMPFGTMGGEGQPQTQAMLFSRYAMNNVDLQQSVTAPRWLLGRTWGSENTSLRIENRFAPQVLEALRAAGHDLDVLGDFDEVMGHAGALVWHPSGLIEGAADPRSDGAAIAV